MGLEELKTEWRIWLLAFALIFSLVMLSPSWNDQGTGFKTNLNTGIEISGGIKVLLAPNTTANVTEENVTRTMNTLEQRISAFGLTQTSTRLVKVNDNTLIQLKVSNITRERLEQLTSQNGSFSARMPYRVSGTETFEFSHLDASYTMKYVDGVLKAENRTYRPNETFMLEGVKFYYHNNTENYANLEVTVYTDQDIIKVKESEASVANKKFSIPILLDTERARIFQDITQNYRSLGGNLAHEDGSLVGMNLYVEGSKVSSLQTVSSGFKRGGVPRESYITGGGATNAEARQQMNALIAILQAGKLQYPLTVEEFSRTSARYGNLFMSTAFLSIVASLIAVGGLIYLRYGHPKYVLPIVLTGSSEVLILLGTFFSTVVTLDLTSIAGIIAAVGTGVDDQIIITDESDREQMLDWAERLKKAFFVIFTSAASTIGAMIPVVSPSFAYQAVGAAGAGLILYTLYTRRSINPHFIAIGSIALIVSVVSATNLGGSYALQQVRGFAVTTILGVMIGISITRPAYAKIIEHID
ncbi:MAG: hypothetical protein ABEJ98_00190 [Candidatus Nanohaloarchaea archaeon]